MRKSLLAETMEGEKMCLNAGKLVKILWKKVANKESDQIYSREANLKKSRRYKTASKLHMSRSLIP